MWRYIKGQDSYLKVQIRSSILSPECVSGNLYGKVLLSILGEVKKKEKGEFRKSMGGIYKVLY